MLICRDEDQRSPFEHLKSRWCDQSLSTSEMLALVGTGEENRLHKQENEEAASRPSTSCPTRSSHQGSLRDLATAFLLDLTLLL